MSDCDRDPHALPDDCREIFSRIFTKLDAIDEALRGDMKAGTPGIKQRVDQLEDEKHKRNSLLFFLAGALVAGLVQLIGVFADKLVS